MGQKNKVIDSKKKERLRMRLRRKRCGSSVGVESVMEI